MSLFPHRAFKKSLRVVPCGAYFELFYQLILKNLPTLSSYPAGTTPLFLPN